MSAASRDQPGDFAKKGNFNGGIALIIRTKAMRIYQVGRRDRLENSKPPTLMIKYEFILTNLKVDNQNHINEAIGHYIQFGDSQSAVDFRRFLGNKEKEIIFTLFDNATKAVSNLKKNVPGWTEDQVLAIKAEIFEGITYWCAKREELRALATNA